jgi:hypothetical protein
VDPADPADPEPQPDPELRVYSDREWPDLRAYFPEHAQYEQRRVVYATGFEPEEYETLVCICEDANECQGAEENPPECGALWYTRGGGERLEYSEFALQGNYSLRIFERGRGWSGARINLMPFLLDDVHEYEVLVWVRMSPDADHGRVGVVGQVVDEDGGVEYPWYQDWSFPDYDEDPIMLSKYFLPAEFYIVNEDGTEQHPTRDGTYNIQRENVNGEWVLLRGTNTFLKNWYEEIYTYFEASVPGGASSLNQDIYVDAFVLLAVE